MAEEAIQQTVKDYILQEFLAGESPDSLDVSTPLISGGILDSISTLKLVSFLEDQYSVEFAAHEVSADHIDSLGSIAKIVAAKVAAK